MIIIICHQSGLNRPVSASSNSLFKGLPSLRPSALELSITFGHLTFVLVTCCSQLDLYELSLWSTGSTFNSSKISSFLLWSKSVYPAVLLKKNFISIHVNRLLSFCMRAQISLSCRRKRTASALYTFIVEDFWSKIGLKLLFRISNM